MSAHERYDRSIVWLRRDLRLDDNVALLEASRSSRAVCITFVVNPPLLANPRMGAPLVNVFFGALAALRAELRQHNGDLVLLCGDFTQELYALANRIGAQALFFNEDYEPQALERDRAVARAFEARELAVHTALDHVYYGADELATSDGGAYRVFTPFLRRWLERHGLEPRPPVPSRRALAHKLLPRSMLGAVGRLPRPESFGFASSASYPRTSEALARSRLAAFLKSGGPVERYGLARDVPAVDGTSRLSPHLRAGTIGIRTCVEHAFARRDGCSGKARDSVQRWISELVWRDFYQMILRRFPHVANGPFVEAAEAIRWRDSERDFRAWCSGLTGYPIVDAAMRQLNESGWMHNRLRMVVASFLTKHLLVDWREGERYFEQHLADADVAQNNGGWQWAASTGTDAAPYFRIFNPTLQSERFDPGGSFIKAWVPELRGVPAPFVHEPSRMPPLLRRQSGLEIGATYPLPIVEHGEARSRAIAAFASVLGRTQRRPGAPGHGVK